MTAINQFEDIKAWQEARLLTQNIYIITNRTMFSKDYALKDQIRRAVISVMNNIAEGFERDSDKEFSHFLSIAKGSCGEVRSLLYASLDQSYIDKIEFQKLYASADETMKMIAGLMRYMRNSDLLGKKYKKSMD